MRAQCPVPPDPSPPRARQGGTDRARATGSPEPRRDDAGEASSPADQPGALSARAPGLRPVSGSSPERPGDDSTAEAVQARDRRALPLDRFELNLPGGPEHREKLIRLGVDPETAGSRICQLLPKRQLLRVRAVSAADRAKVLWFDPELARLFGFPVPPSNQMTEALERALCEALAFHLPTEGEPDPAAPALDLLADQYAGSGIGANRGAGRAAFFPYLNLYAKGIGRTPLCASEKNDRIHEHGLQALREAGIEAIWGKVGTHLLSGGALPTLAIIDIGESVDWAPGKRERAGLLIRAGRHLRPAHILARDGCAAREIFLRAGAELGVEGGVEAIAREMLDRQARAAAEMFRWRLLHGAISTSNILCTGEQIDTPTMMSQLRTARIRAMRHGAPFGSEHLARARELELMYEAVLAQMGKKGKRAGRIDFTAEMAARYRAHLEVELLKATGVKAALARRLQAEKPQLVAGYTDLLLRFAALQNRNEAPVAFFAPVRDLSVLDIFHLLAALPPLLFRGGRPVMPRQVYDLLEPCLSDAQGSVTSTELQLVGAAAEFLARYRDLMATAERLAAEYYDGGEAGAAAAMKAAIVARAAFENRPLDRLEHEPLTRDLEGVLARYEPRNPASLLEVQRYIDRVVQDSVRNVDALLAQGTAGRLPDGAVELEQRTIAGVDYAVRVQPGPAARRSVRVSLPLEPCGADTYVATIARARIVLRAEEVPELEFYATTDGWRPGKDGKVSVHRAPARLEVAPEGSASLVFELPAAPNTAAELEGVFHRHGPGGDVWFDDAGQNFRGYAFAIPDDHDLAALAL